MQKCLGYSEMEYIKRKLQYIQAYKYVLKNWSRIEKCTDISNHQKYLLALHGREFSIINNTDIYPILTDIEEIILKTELLALS